MITNDFFAIAMRGPKDNSNEFMLQGATQVAIHPTADIGCNNNGITKNSSPTIAMSFR